jgi:predicted small integral membrane protein
MSATKSNEMDAPITILEDEDSDEQAVSTGFLPIVTNWFDRLFISVVIWVAISLFWLRFIEPLGLSIWISNALALILAVFIIRKG